MTTTGDLGHRLEAIPGVASAEIDITDEGPPVARVRLDGSESAEIVRTRIDALLGSSVADIDASPGRTRRSGLGKGLSEVMSLHGEGDVPTLLSGVAAVEEPRTIVRVAVVETGSGVAVEVEDSDGNEGRADVTDSLVDDAVVRAVAALRGIETDVDIDLTDVDTPAGAVVVATSIDGEDRSVGAAFVGPGRFWAVATAVFALFAD